MAAVSGSQDLTLVQQRLSIAYETNELSMVLRVLNTHKKEFSHLEQAKVAFAIHFLGFIKSDDPVGAIRENATLFDNATVAEEAVRRHFTSGASASSGAGADETADLRGRVALERRDLTFDPKQLAFIRKRSEEGDLRGQVATIRAARQTFSAKDLQFVPREDSSSGSELEDEAPAVAAAPQPKKAPPLPKRPSGLLAQVRVARKESNHH